MALAFSQASALKATSSHFQNTTPRTQNTLHATEIIKSKNLTFIRPWTSLTASTDKTHSTSATVPDDNVHTTISPSLFPTPNTKKAYQKHFEDPGHYNKQEGKGHSALFPFLHKNINN